MIYTDGNGGIDLFPRYNVGAIALQAPWSLAVSDTGDRIGFRFNDGVYVGHIGRADAVADAPVIKEIQLYPPITSAELAQQGTTLRAYIDDPQGVEDIIRTQTNGLVSGATNKSDQNGPVFIPYPVNDAGVPPDQEKGDGIFSCAVRPGRKPEAFSQTHVRVAAMDKSFTVTVADAPLTEGGKLGAVAVGKTVKGLENNTNRPGSDVSGVTGTEADITVESGCEEGAFSDPYINRSAEPIACEPQTFVSDLTIGILVEVTILGAEEGGCRFEERVIEDNTDLGFLDKEMTCLFPDGELDGDITDYCEGSLVDAFLEVTGDA